MESLYTKYRPQTFEQVVGQKHVVETLKRAVVEGRTSHAYLFCGPRGTGKTTMARLLAKALMCEKGPGQLPDGTCEQCRLIAAGEHPDVAELDAASRTGVDNVREEILSRVNYAPTLGRCKVYIIDEVHMLTPAAFNALLKTLEEPPEHVVFIMCTTDPQKILATILSRVQRFDFHSIGNDEMQAHLAYVCGEEGFTYDDAALELVVRHARGGMRDALTSLEQLSVFGNGNISVAAAQDFLGEVSGSVLGGVVNALAKRDVPALFGEVEKLMSSGRDLLQFTKELAARMRDVYVVAAVPCATDVVSARGADFEALRSEAAAFGSVDRLSRILTVLGDASSEMRTATNQRLVLEIAFTRIARPEADLTLEALADRVAYLEHELETLKKSGLPVAAPSQPAPTPQVNQGTPATAPATAPSAPAPAAPVQPAAAPQAVAQPGATVPAPVAGRAGGVSPRPSRAASEPQGERRGAGRNPSRSAGPTEPAAAPARPAMTDPAELQRTWKRVVDNLVHEAPSKGSLLMSSSPVSDDGEKLVVSLPKGSRFAAKMLERADVRETVDGCVRVAFGHRQLVFVESSMANKAIANADRAAAAPTPRPAASAPATVPAPVAPRLVPAPVPAAPQPAAPTYDAPWDDVPPYSDNDAAAYASEDAGQPASPTPPPAASDMPASRAPVAVSPAEGTSLGASREASEARSAERRAAEGSPFGGASASDPAPFSPSDQPEPGVVEDVSSHPEFSDIASMLTEAFGAPLSMSVEPAVTTSDDDAAAELSYDDNGADEDPGFADEPEDDADAED